MTRKDDEEYEEEDEEEEEIEEDEEEDDSLTLDDVKDVADTASSVFKAIKAFKDISDDSESEKGYHKTSTPRPPAPDERKPGIWDRYLFKVRKPRSEVEEKLDMIEKKIDQTTKHQNRKWYIGIGIAIGLAIISLFFL